MRYLVMIAAKIAASSKFFELRVVKLESAGFYVDPLGLMLHKEEVIR